MHKEKLSYKEAARQFDVSFDTVVAGWVRIYLEEGPEGLYIERRGKKYRTTKKTSKRSRKRFNRRSTTIKSGECIIERN